MPVGLETLYFCSGRRKTIFVVGHKSKRVPSLGQDKRVILALGSGSLPSNFQYKNVNRGFSYETHLLEIEYMQFVSRRNCTADDL